MPLHAESLVPQVALQVPDLQCILQTDTLSPQLQLPPSAHSTLQDGLLPEQTPLQVPLGHLRSHVAPIPHVQLPPCWQAPVQLAPVSQLTVHVPEEQLKLHLAFDLHTQVPPPPHSASHFDAGSQVASHVPSHVVVHCPHAAGQVTFEPFAASVQHPSPFAHVCALQVLGQTTPPVAVLATVLVTVPAPLAVVVVAPPEPESTPPVPPVLVCPLPPRPAEPPIPAEPPTPSEPPTEVPADSVGANRNGFMLQAAATAESPSHETTAGSGRVLLSNIPRR